MNKQGKGSKYWREKFSDAKLKEGIFIRPQIRETINDDLFVHLLTELRNKYGYRSKRFIYYKMKWNRSLKTTNGLLAQMESRYVTTCLGLF